MYYGEFENSQLHLACNSPSYVTTLTLGSLRDNGGDSNENRKRNKAAEEF